MQAEVDDVVIGDEPDEVVGIEEAAEEAQIFNLLHKTDGDRLVKRTDKEVVVQAAARSLGFEYGFDLADMERSVPITLTTISEQTGKAKTRRIKLDLAAFEPKTPHRQEHIIRAGVIAPKGTKHDDERRGLPALDEILGALDRCEFGFWTNGTELAFRRKTFEGHVPIYVDVSDMPAAGESLESLVDVTGRRRLVAVTAETLGQTFRRCHDYIYGNQGISKADAFWAFLRLIFCKMYDEVREEQGRRRRFWVGLTERFDPDGQRAIKARLDELFEEVKGNGSVPSPYIQYFKPEERIGLEEPVLAYVAGELSRYDLLHSSEDAKGAAFEEIIDRKQKAERGQFFTPRNVIRLMVEMLDPSEEDYILDPACGTGGFLVIAFRHVRNRIEKRLRAEWSNPGTLTPTQRIELQETAREWAHDHIWGFDFDPDLVKAAQMNLAMNGGDGQVYWIDSLKFPEGQTADLARVLREIQTPYGAAEPTIGNLNTFTLCFTNPPFGSKIPFNDRAALERFELAGGAEGQAGYGRRRTRAARKTSLPPEVLFVERCIQWVRPGGRVAIVLPDGILGNPKDVYIRRWVLDQCDVLASVDLPVETFLPQVGVQPSLLFLRKKTPAEKQAEGLGTRTDRSVFMAIVDRVGKDRRGNVIYRRNPDGTDAPPVRRVERRTVLQDGHEVEVDIPMEELQVDDELPQVLAAWQHFLASEDA